MFEKAYAIARSKETSLRKIAEMVSEDPRQFFRDAQFAGVDLSGQDLTGFDLSLADFEGVIASASTDVDKQYRPQLFSAALLNRGAQINLAKQFDIDTIVMMARAGDVDSANRALISGYINRQNVKYELYSQSLILCEEIDAKLRIRYHEKWREDYIDHAGAALAWALLSNGFGDEYLGEILIQDVSNFIENRLRRAFTITDYLERTVMSYVLNLATIRNRSKNHSWLGEGLFEPVSSYLLQGSPSWEQKFEVFKCIVIFPELAGHIEDLLLDFIVIEPNRKVGSLLARAIKTVRNLPQVFSAGVAWLSRNIRASASDSVLLALLDLEYWDQSLVPVLLKWRRLGPKAIEDRRALGQALDHWLNRAGPNAVSEPTLLKLRELASSYRRVAATVDPS